MIRLLPLLALVPTLSFAASFKAAPKLGTAAALPKTAAVAPAMPNAKVAAAAATATPALQPLAEAAKAGAQQQGAAAATPEQANAALFDGAKAAPKEWTFMVFLNGHNNLDRFGALNISQMEKIGSDDKVNIVVQWASMGKPTKRLLIQKGPGGRAIASPILESLPAVDMGDVNQFYEFVRWTVEKFPAQKYAIDVWNHGSGWRYRGARPALPQDVSNDDQTGNVITTEQLGDALRKIKTLIGKPVDVLAFDACLMAMAEVAAEVKDSVRYFAGSEELEPGAGWKYDKVLEQWLKTPDDDGRALVTALTDQFIAAYPREVTFSGADLTKLPAYLDAAKALAKELVALDAKAFKAAKDDAYATRRYGFRDYGDALDFVLRAAANPAVGLSAAVVDAYKAAHKDLIVASKNSPDRDGSHGLSVWLPTEPSLWKYYGKRYAGLAWSKLTGWADAARRLAGAPAARRSRPLAGNGRGKRSKA